MKDFYHLSHFFEFFAGLYFGSFPLLRFIQNDATISLGKRVKKREQDALDARIKILEYYTPRVNPRNGAIKTHSETAKWKKSTKGEERMKKILDYTNFVIGDIVDQNGYFIKRIFPVFFYTGLFSLATVLFSGYEQVSNNSLCKSHIDAFYVFYFISTIPFQIWGLFKFPKIVTNRNYLKLTVINITICIILFSCSLILTFIFYDSPLISFCFAKVHEDIFISLTILIAISPIILLGIFCSWILILWYISNVFYSTTLSKFESAANKDLEKFKKDTPTI